MPPLAFAADELLFLDEEPDVAAPDCFAPLSLPAFALAEFAPLPVPVGCGGGPLVWAAVALGALLPLSLFPLALWLLPAARVVGVCCGAGGGLGAGGTLLFAGLVTPASSRAANGCALTLWFCADAADEGDETAVEALGAILGTLGTGGTPEE